MFIFVRILLFIWAQDKQQHYYTVPVLVSLSCVAIGNVYESWHSTWLRSWAMDECLEQIKADDQFTHCISIGPVSPSCLQ